MLRRQQIDDRMEAFDEAANYLVMLLDNDPELSGPKASQYRKAVEVIRFRASTWFDNAVTTLEEREEAK